MLHWKRPFTSTEEAAFYTDFTAAKYRRSKTGSKESLPCFSIFRFSYKLRMKGWGHSVQSAQEVFSRARQCSTLPTFLHRELYREGKIVLMHLIFARWCGYLQLLRESSQYCMDN